MIIVIKQDNIILYYTVAVSGRNTRQRGQRLYILASSCNRENEIEMHSARLRPLSRSPADLRSLIFVE